MRRFGITFDLQDPGRPDTVEHAAAYVRTWAAFIGAEIREDAEEFTEYLEASEGGTAFQLRVEYRWELVGVGILPTVLPRGREESATGVHDHL